MDRCKNVCSGKFHNLNFTNPLQHAATANWRKMLLCVTSLTRDCMHNAEHNGFDTFMKSHSTFLNTDDLTGEFPNILV